MTSLFAEKDPLDGRTLAISVSHSPDLGRLGLSETHVTAALGEIARVVLASGGSLAYGGHMDPGGYTAFLLSEVGRHRYGVDAPLLRVFLAWSEHRRLPRAELEQQLDVGTGVEVLCLDPHGRVLADPLAARTGEAASGSDALDDTVRRDSLTAMRRLMAEETDGRVLLGGMRTGFAGAMPGLMEEALLTLQVGKPLYLAAGMGGVTADIVRALRIDDCAWLPPDPDAPAEDPRPATGWRRLAAERAALGWSGVRNGLSQTENRRLAATHHPGEIAELVALGLGRVTGDEP